MTKRGATCAGPCAVELRGPLNFYTYRALDGERHPFICAGVDNLWCRGGSRFQVNLIPTVDKQLSAGLVVGALWRWGGTWRQRELLASAWLKVDSRVSLVCINQNYICRGAVWLSKGGGLCWERRYRHKDTCPWAV